MNKPKSKSAFFTEYSGFLHDITEILLKVAFHTHGDEPKYSGRDMLR
jgi:hypothetical protein